MRTSPPLVGPISYSEKSLKRNTLYESANEIYTLIDDTIDTRTLPQSVLTPLTSCYTQFCLPGQGGCYAPCCPNRLEEDDEDDENAQVKCWRGNDCERQYSFGLYYRVNEEPSLDDKHHSNR